MKRFYLVLIFALNMVVLTMADYRIGYSFNGYNSSNTLFDGSCCGGNCTAGCRTTLRLCFRDAGHSHNNVESNCTQVVNRENSNNFFQSSTLGDVITDYYSQTFQIYVRVSHSFNESSSLADFDPPFTDPLIDDIFIEANIEAVTFDALIVNTETYTVTGDFGIATVTIAVHVRCAPNYFGENCEMLCESDGNNCSTVLTPPPTTITSTTMDSTTMDSTDTSSDVPDPTNQLPTTEALSSPTVNVVPIVVGILVALVILIIIIVIIVVLIIYFVKKSKKGSWNPRRNTQPRFTLEKVESNLTSSINRFSVISDDGEEVEYAIVNKPKSPALSRPRSPPSPPPPYSPSHSADESGDNTPEIEPAEDFVVQNKEVNKGFGGYETVDFGSPAADENVVRYASLNIHKKDNGVGTVSMEVEAKGTDDNEEDPIQYTIVKHQDS